MINLKGYRKEKEIDRLRGYGELAKEICEGKVFHSVAPLMIMIMI